MNYRGVRVEYHILQSFPVTCLNRDDVGSPKTAFVGGVERGRISSQCWKRQVRFALREQGIHIAVRTKKIEETVLRHIEQPVDELKKSYIEEIAKALAKDTLVFFSDAEAEGIARYVDSETDIKTKLASKDLQKVLTRELSKVMKESQRKGFDKLDGLDIALFGRMVANAVDLNVEAAASFSHAITTHKMSSAIDFFTAVDDFISEDEASAGAGHLGALEYTSGTYYRYISLDLGMLEETLGDTADIVKAVDAFTKALYIAVPAARQTTLAGLCPWSYAHVYVRKGQGLQLCFDKPVKAKGDGYLIPSIEAMEEGLKANETAAGSLFGKLMDFIYDGKTVSIDDLCGKLADTVKSLS